MRRQPQPLSWALSRPLERAPRQVPRVAAPLTSAWRRVLVPLALAVVVAGCAAKGPQPACPTVDVINDLHRTTVFAAGDAGDPAAVSHTLRITDFRAQCVYRKNAITLPVTVTLSAQRGPVNDGGRAPGRYFVAVLNAQDAVITKRVFDVDLAFKEGAQAVFSDEVTLTLPFAAAADLDGWRVLIGLQLSAEALACNRRLRDPR